MKLGDREVLGRVDGLRRCRRRVVRESSGAGVGETECYKYSWPKTVKGERVDREV